MESVLQKNYYLMRDFEDNVVHVFTRKEKAVKIVNELQEQNPKMLIQLTEDIPAAALARALKKKGNETKASETEYFECSLGSPRHGPGMLELCRFHAHVWFGLIVWMCKFLGI